MTYTEAGRLTGPLVFLVTDIESNGPDPGLNSMLSLASVAVTQDGVILDEFSVNLMELPGSKPDPATMDWWRGHSEAYAAATAAPDSAHNAMASWVRWVQSRNVTSIFAAHPLSFDGAWMDWYLQYCGMGRLFDRPREPGITFSAGLDIVSLVMGRTGFAYDRCIRDNYSPEWLGGNIHDHSALSDARGYAHLLSHILCGFSNFSVDSPAADLNIK